MSDVTRLPDPSDALFRLPIGSAVLIRHTDAGARRALAERLAPALRSLRLRLFVSDDLELARALDANGLHLPEARVAGAEAGVLRRAWHGSLTAAAHSPAALQRAARIGCDAAIVSPVFATASHPGRSSIGLLRFLAWTSQSPLPIYAMGGLTATNAGRLHHRKIVGIAGIGGFVGGE